MPLTYHCDRCDKRSEPFDTLNRMRSEFRDEFTPEGWLQVTLHVRLCDDCYTAMFEWIAAGVG